MAHEITKNDGLVLHKNSAWHGLGTVVEEAPTPREALILADMDWTVRGDALQTVNGETVAKYKMNVREDTGQHLGLVGINHKVIQNHEVADFCEALAENNDTIKVETAGSIRGGERIWFLLKGESFSVRGKDEITPYICVSNGHDGYTAFRATPTSVRAVCSNTLHLIIPRAGGRSFTTAGFVAHHTQSVMTRVEEAKEALKLYDFALSETKQVMEHLALQDINSEKVKEFFLKCYTKSVEPIPSNPGTRAENNAVERAMNGWLAFERRFEEEGELTGKSAWGAFNAFTGFFQNDRKVRLKDQDVVTDRMRESKLFGDGANAAHDALMTILAI